MSEPVAKPVPSLEGLSGEWYRWCAKGELRFQRCAACGNWRHPPRYRCATCGGPDWSWERSTGRGTVFTWTVTHQALHPAFADELPYAIVVVELDEGCRVVSGVAGLRPDQLELGMALRVGFEVRSPALTVPVFRPE